VNPARLLRIDAGGAMERWETLFEGSLVRLWRPSYPGEKGARKSLFLGVICLILMREHPLHFQLRRDTFLMSPPRLKPTAGFFGQPAL
jgi:hypothetical protein